MDKLLAWAQEWINLKESRASIARTSQTPTQPIFAVTDAATTAHTLTKINQGGNNKRKGNGEPDHSGTKKKQAHREVQAYLRHVY